SYGGGSTRPLLRTGTSNGAITFGGGGSPPRIDYVAIIGIHFWAHTHDGTVNNFHAMHFLMPGEGLLIEDCKVEQYGSGIVFTPPEDDPLNAVELRRNVVVDSFTTLDFHAQGMFASSIEGLLLEENVFDYNGWNADIPGASANIFRHNIYLSGNNSNDVQVVGNIITRGASHGIQARTGGWVFDNLFARNSISVLISDGVEQGFSALVEENVILDGKNISGTELRGWGINANNADSTIVHRNIVANNVDGDFPRPMDFGANAGDPVLDLEFTDNIFYNWGGSVRFDGAADGFHSVHLARNHIQSDRAQAVLDHAQLPTTFTSADNRLWSEANPLEFIRMNGAMVDLATWQAQVADVGSTREMITYPDPSRSIARYNAEVLGGSASFEAFTDQVRLQSKDFWRAEYTAKQVNDWIRAGFGRELSHIFVDGFESGSVSAWSSTSP
ncbi:MAG: right-handed parallel beta-helix repeat-containing protein, partial [Thermoanaerobaculia bacterium]|nr:right-handed parallel beta-helix repeat-containing protein [Thermoanaerobaculia bacterium]